MVTYMNAREALLCQAIKDAGIEIYAIGFRITAGGTADQLLANCATQDGSHYYHADTQAELLEAFSAIGTGIGQLRLTH
jgi:asparagine synthetase A